MPPIAGDEIQTVHDNKQLADYGRVMGLGFELPDDVIDFFLPVMRTGDVVESYVGYLNGEPVSAGTTMYGAGVAGFYNGTVLETARNKGIGTANALHRIKMARMRGYRVGFMISGGNAYNLYQRLGFKEYTPWRRYLWMPSTDAEV